MPAVMDAAASSAEQREIDPLLLHPIRVEEEMLRLRGPPHALVGIATLTRGPEPARFNRGSRNLVETEAGYRLGLSQAKLVSSSLPAGRVGAAYLRFDTEIPPETKARVPARFAVAETTPPGVYEAVFDIGGEPRRAEIEVLPDERLAIGANNLILSGAPGEVARGDLLFTNGGNVALKLDVLGGLILEDLEPLCLNVQRALSQVRDKECQDDAHRLFLDALIKNLADQRADMGRVRLADGPVILEPGNSEVLGVEFHLPPGLAPGRHYKATLQYAGAQVSLRINAVAPARGAVRGKAVKRKKEAV